MIGPQNKQHIENMYILAKGASRQQFLISTTAKFFEVKGSSFIYFFLSTVFAENIFSSYLNALKLLCANLFLMNFHEYKFFIIFFFIFIIKHDIKFQLGHCTEHANRLPTFSFFFYIHFNASTIIQTVIVQRLEPMRKTLSHYEYGRTQ